MPKVAYISLVSLCLSASLTLAQNANQAAVDTLTKDVAIAVFAGISQPKAQEIYAQLLDCAEGCDPQQVIRGVGSWDQVGAKMQELAMLKNTAAFVAMSPGDANTAIRRQLAQFYAKYKSDKNYGKPLSPAVQSQILAKVDGMLPPAAAAEPAPQPDDKSAAAAETTTDDETSITPAALQLSQLERQKREAEEKQLWMMILGALAGLVVGAGAVYLLAYRTVKNEVVRLTDENAKLSQQNDSLRTKPANETRPTNEPRQPQGDLRQKASAYDAIMNELGTTSPLVAIRQLKQQASSTIPSPAPVVRSGEPVIETNAVIEPVPVQPQSIAPILVPTAPIETVAPARSEVFYFPPPDPTGQFDSQQKSGVLSPESAYRFSINASNPSVASFRFEAEPGRVARFLTYRNYMIEPACESENSYTTTHTRIVMRRDGEAVLENGTWRVKAKALIRYE